MPKYRFALPTLRDVRPVDPVLTSLSVGFKNDRFLWDQIAPVARTDQQSGTYFIYDRDFWFRRREGAERPAEGDYTQVGYGLSTSTFNCREYGFEKPLGQVTRAASQTPEDLQTTDVDFLTNLMQLELELRVAGVVMGATAWGTTRTLTGTNQWSDFANSDPIADSQLAIRTVRRATGTAPNALFIGLVGWEKLAEHPLVLDKYKHSQVGVMTPQLVAAAIGVGEVVVGDSIQNTADEGAAFSGSDIWTDNGIYYVKRAPGLRTTSGAVSFIWDERGNVPWGVETYEWEKTRSTITRVFTHIHPVVISSAHGYELVDIAA